ncbi:molybdenum ABC transporter permease [Pedobacter frigoris]|uniref:Molybdenum ABC transporter permease n=1 Tax=Pedobacter frigoris TaxID=2571272 RepID=A0A4U1CBZ9_9SPHI|nr:molybdenum ABC transporter permease [Pedobacter frigoris]TKC04249.1 molybdenum ABC transporter permease [Pedobacter frigoris]
MFSNLDTSGLVMFCIGLLIRYLIDKRKFRRRNIAGMQVFSSYLNAVVFQLFERIFNLLGLLLIVLGVVTILMRL